MFITRGPASLTPNVTRFHRTGTGQAICQRSPQNASRNDAVEIKHINIAILDQQGKEMGYTNNIHQKKRCDVGSVTRKGRKIDADRLDDHSAHPPTSANTALDGERQGKTGKERRTLNHDVDRVYRWGSPLVRPRQRSGLTIVLHLERRRRIVLTYPISVVQKSVSVNLSLSKMETGGSAPNARHIFAHFGRISPLQLAQFRISLDFEKDFVPC